MYTFLSLVLLFWKHIHENSSHSSKTLYESIWAREGEEKTIWTRLFMKCCIQDMHNEIQDVLGQSFGLPDDLDEDDLMGELDALDDEMAAELDVGGRAGVPSYLQVSPLPSLLLI